MKKLKLGFTLAEVTTAMLIVGVVAAMVIPQVVKSVQQNQTGAMLGRVVEQIQVGNQSLIQYANSNIASQGGTQVDCLAMIKVADLTLSNNPADHVSIMGTFTDVVIPYWSLVPREVVVDASDFKNFNGNPGALWAEFINNSSCYNFTKLPAAVCVNSLNPGGYNDEKDDQLGIQVFVDTNGWENKPNTYGKDIFLFTLRNNGSLVPWSAGNSGIERTEQIVNDGFKILD